MQVDGSHESRAFLAVSRFPNLLQRSSSSMLAFDPFLTMG